MSQKQKTASAKKRRSPQETLVNIIMIAVVVVVLGFGCWAVVPVIQQHIQNNAPVNTEIPTVAEAADEAGMTAEEFIQTYALPSEITGDTSMADAIQTMTVENYAKYNGQTTEEFLEANMLPETITGSSTMAEAQEAYAEYLNSILAAQNAAADTAQDGTAASGSVAEDTASNAE